MIRHQSLDVSELREPMKLKNQDRAYCSALVFLDINLCTMAKIDLL